MGSNLLVCRSCSYEMQENCMSDDELKALYSNSYYDTYGSIEKAASQKRVYFNRVLDTLILKPGGKILEVGCGTGTFLSVCKSRGYDAYGLDINAFGIGIAGREIESSKLFCKRFENLEGDEHFDNIFMFDYIEHVKNQEEILKIAFTRLKNNGSLVITTPSTSSLSNLLMGSKWPHYIKEHLSFFSKKSLNLLLIKTGYSDIKIKNLNKIVTLDYLYSQIIGKSMAVAPLVNFFYRFLPQGLKEKVLSINTGDIIAIAQKNNCLN